MSVQNLEHEKRNEVPTRKPFLASESSESASTAPPGVAVTTKAPLRLKSLSAVGVENLDPVITKSPFLKKELSKPKALHFLQSDSTVSSGGIVSGDDPASDSIKEICDKTLATSWNKAFLNLAMSNQRAARRSHLPSPGVRRPGLARSSSVESIYRQGRSRTNSRAGSRGSTRASASRSKARVTTSRQGQKSADHVTSRHTAPGRDMTSRQSTRVASSTSGNARGGGGSNNNRYFHLQALTPVPNARHNNALRPFPGSLKKYSALGQQHALKSQSQPPPSGANQPPIAVASGDVSAAKDHANASQLAQLQSMESLVPRQRRAAQVRISSTTQRILSELSFPVSLRSSRVSGAVGGGGSLQSRHMSRGQRSVTGDVTPRTRHAATRTAGSSCIVATKHCSNCYVVVAVLFSSNALESY